jgi:hypothetical protein
LIVATMVAVVGILAMFTAVVLNALQGLRTELRHRR